MSYEIAVIGSGPAGLSAAVQARQRGKSVVVIGGNDRDGALYKTERVDNYLGFYAISGRELLERFADHARTMGVERMQGRVLNILPMGGTFYLSVGSEMVEARAVVLTPGVARAAKFPGEAEHLGAGVSYCATCDGMLYRGRRVVVVGKSAESAEEAAFLQRLGCLVTFVADRRPAELPEEIPFVRSNRVEILGEGSVTAVRAGGEEIPCEGVFLLRPAIPPADLLPALALEDGFIRVDRNMATNLPGVFAAGDCTGQPLQIAKAVGEGLVAGQRAAEYVDAAR